MILVTFNVSKAPRSALGLSRFALPLTPPVLHPNFRRRIVAPANRHSSEIDERFAGIRRASATSLCVMATHSSSVAFRKSMCSRVDPLHQLIKRPKPPRHASLHSGANPQRPLHSYKVVVCEVERDSRPEVLNLLRDAFVKDRASRCGRPERFSSRDRARSCISAASCPHTSKSHQPRSSSA